MQLLSTAGATLRYSSQASPSIRRLNWPIRLQNHKRLSMGCKLRAEMSWAKEVKPKIPTAGKRSKRDFACWPRCPLQIPRATKMWRCKTMEAIIRRGQSIEKIMEVNISKKKILQLNLMSGLNNLSRRVPKRRSLEMKSQSMGLKMASTVLRSRYSTTMRHFSNFWIGRHSWHSRTKALASAN